MIQTLKYDYIKDEIVSNCHSCTHEWKFTHACAHVCCGVCVCVCARLYVCSCYIYKMFPHTETYSLFHSISFKKNSISVSRIRCQT